MTDYKPNLTREEKIEIYAPQIGKMLDQRLELCDLFYFEERKTPRKDYRIRS
jgi:hypothetical protein